tara:strand:- start:312 stop:950 length:639 start_codon:yes stop_codon:yes gene_type:complete
MKIAFLTENSQASKSPAIFEQLNNISSELGNQAFNLGMLDENDHSLTYIHLGIIASLLLNSKSVDFIITGCGTGQGALMSLNTYPGVTCGYCIDPSDAYLFSQINNGNALSLPFAKGFGWGAELNIKYIFEKAFTGQAGQGYPVERRVPQQENAAILNTVKESIAKNYIEGLKSLDSNLIKTAIGSKHLQEFFFENCKDKELHSFIKSIINS